VHLLLDTHILLWWLNDDSSLSAKSRELICDTTNLKIISAASLWEIRIKQQIKKLQLPKNFSAVVDQQPFEQLTIKPVHTDELLHLPMHHRDPFDRMLIAQARHEKLTLLTHDEVFKQYNTAIILN